MIIKCKNNLLNDLSICFGAVGYFTLAKTEQQKKKIIIYEWMAEFERTPNETS